MNTDTNKVKSWLRANNLPNDAAAVRDTLRILNWPTQTETLLRDDAALAENIEENTQDSIDNGDSTSEPFNSLITFYNNIVPVNQADRAKLFKFFLFLETVNSLGVWPPNLESLLDYNEDAIIELFSPDSLGSDNDREDVLMEE